MRDVWQKEALALSLVVVVKEEENGMNTLAWASLVLDTGDGTRETNERTNERVDGWMDGWGERECSACVRVWVCGPPGGCTQLIQGIRNERWQETPKIAGAVALLAKQVERGLSGLLFARLAQHAAKVEPRRVASLKAFREGQGRPGTRGPLGSGRGWK